MKRHSAVETGSPCRHFCACHIAYWTCESSNNNTFSWQKNTDLLDLVCISCLFVFFMLKCENLCKTVSFQLVKQTNHASQSKITICKWWRNDGFQWVHLSTKKSTGDMETTFSHESGRFITNLLVSYTVSCEMCLAKRSKSNLKNRG
jgi:hypothetical protein